MEAGGNKIGILGCGWLGFPLARRILEEGFQVKGSTTSPRKLAELKAAGIEEFHIRVLPKEIQGDITAFLEGLEALIIDFPPGSRDQPAKDYISSMEGLTTRIKASSVKKILFVSSISVYEDSETIPLYTEEALPNAVGERGRALVAVEDLFRAENSYVTTVLRLGGLIGPDRHPVNQLSGRKGIANGEAPINLIHQEDGIGIILNILSRDSFGETFNAVYPEHPSKEKYYQTLAKRKELPLPEFTNSNSKGKIIDSNKVQELLDYQFTGGIYK